MTKFILKHFVKEDSRNQRQAYAICASIVGILSNIVLFTVKGLIGFFAGSMAMISDAFNNLSDCLSFCISLVGFRIAGKPADKEHPFGHGRIEYLITLVVVVFIFIVGFEFLSQSLQRIKNPIPTKATPWMVLILIFTIIVKLWLSSFLGTVGRESDNLALIASSQDSRNDVFITIVAVVALVLSSYSSEISYDGIAGVVVSLFIFYSGYQIARETIAHLLGPSLDGDIVHEVKDIISRNPSVLGVHDLIIHDYGPSVRMGSAHVEMSNTYSLSEAHQIVDEIEKEIQEKCNISLTLHIDPVDMLDDQANTLKEFVQNIIQEKDMKLSMHDFHFDKEKEIISFDLKMPFDLSISENEIRTYIMDELKKKDITYACDITFDAGFTTTRSK